jgi:hypothetical protein
LHDSRSLSPGKLFDYKNLCHWPAFSLQETPDVIKHLLHAIWERVSPTILSVYMAHLILRQVDWSIRYHDRATVDYYLRVAEHVLRDVGL